MIQVGFTTSREHTRVLLKRAQAYAAEYPGITWGQMLPREHAWLLIRAGMPAAQAYPLMGLPAPDLPRRHWR